VLAGVITKTCDKISDSSVSERSKEPLAHCAKNFLKRMSDSFWSCLKLVRELPPPAHEPTVGVDGATPGFQRDTVSTMAGRGALTGGCCAGPTD